MTVKATATEAGLRRAMKAAQECGLTVHECVMTPGKVRLIFSAVDQDAEKADHPKLEPWPER